MKLSTVKNSIILEAKIDQDDGPKILSIVKVNKDHGSVSVTLKDPSRNFDIFIELQTTSDNGLINLCTADVESDNIQHLTFGERRVLPL